MGSLSWLIVVLSWREVTAGAGVEGADDWALLLRLNGVPSAGGITVCSFSSVPSGTFSNCVIEEGGGGVLSLSFI